MLFSLFHVFCSLSIAALSICFRWCTWAWSMLPDSFWKRTSSSLNLFSWGSQTVRQSDDWVFQVTTWYQYNLCIKYLTHQQDSNSSRTSVARICWEYMLLYCVVLICWVCPISEASRVHHSDVVSGTALELHLGAGHKAKAGTVHQSSSAAFGMQYSYKILICNIHLREIFWNVIVFNPYYGSYWIGHHLKEWSYCRCTGMPIVFLWVFHLRS